MDRELTGTKLCQKAGAVCGGSVMMSGRFAALRTRELRELLEDEGKVNHIIRCSEKVQRLQRAAEKTLVSSSKYVKISLSQKPRFRDVKLLLTMKYRELENLRSIIQAKREQLAEKHSVGYAQWILLKKINDEEEESEMLFERFAEGKTPLADFLDSFLSSRRLHHIRTVLVKKLQEMMDFQSTQRLAEIQRFTAEQIHDACLPVCGLTVLPACCHPPFLLLPCGTPVNAAHCLQHASCPHDYKLTQTRTKRPGRPVRLQPLKVQQQRHQQAPP